MNLSIVLCTYIISGPRYFFYILLETSYEGEGLDKFGEIKVLDDNGLFFYFASQFKTILFVHVITLHIKANNLLFL